MNLSASFNIADYSCFQSRLSESIEKLFDLTAKCSPSIIISKPKFHFLVHLPEFIRRFGPAIIFSTERYESFNGVFRRASTLSNRQAPSRDICKAFAEQEMVKHIVSGGYWLDPNLKKWVQAGLGVLEHFRDHPEHQRLLGVPRSEEKSCGEHFLNHLTSRGSSDLLLVKGLSRSDPRKRFTNPTAETPSGSVHPWFHGPAHRPTSFPRHKVSLSPPH